MPCSDTERIPRPPALRLRSPDGERRLALSSRWFAQPALRLVGLPEHAFGLHGDAGETERLVGLLNGERFVRGLARASVRLGTTSAKMSSSL